MDNRILQKIATLGFIGFFPLAPGTAGSAVSFLLMFLLKPADPVLIILLFAIIPVGIIAATHAERLLGKDSGHIIIDEFCGYLVSILFIPRSAGYLLAAFFIFRFFDILKPPPIGKLEEVVPGGTGIMLDDLLAGIYTNIFLQLWFRL